jgi:hypothetical protein
MSKDHSPQSIVLVGNLSEGYTAHGPFDCHDDAAEWASKHYLPHYDWIMTIFQPSLGATPNE